MPKKSNRTAENRESQSRARSWQPPSALATPPKIEGYTYKWVRAETKGSDDETNVVKRLNEGYEPVRREEIPEGFKSELVEDGKYTGVLRSGDLILCKMPDEMVAQRNEYYRDRAKRQEDSVNTDLLKNQSSLMPISSESRSRTTTGKVASFQE